MTTSPAAISQSSTSKDPYLMEDEEEEEEEEEKEEEEGVEVNTYSRSHGKIAITVITSNGGKTVNGIFAARCSNTECTRRLNVLQ